MSEPTVLTPNSYNADWLSPDELRSLTRQKVIERVTGLSDFVAQHALECERLRRPVDAVWSAIRKTGIFYLYVPKKFGGLGDDSLQTYIDVILPIAEACTSTAWCTAFSVRHQMVLAQFSEEFQKEMWGSLPYFTSAGSGFPPGKAVRADGGLRVSGRWKWGSGIMHAEWVNVIAIAEEKGEKVPYFCFIPIDQAKVLDTWYVDGMCGTGSNDIVVEDVYVPDYRIRPFAELAQGQIDNPNPLYRIPQPPALALTTAIPTLGATRGAVKRFRARLESGGPGGTPSQRQTAHAVLGKADMDVVAAEFMIREGARLLQELAARDQYMTVAERLRVRALLAYGGHLCLGALRAIQDISGTSEHFLDRPLQRAMRDVQMICTHGSFEMALSMELHGKVMIGLASNHEWFK